MRSNTSAIATMFQNGKYQHVVDMIKSTYSVASSDPSLMQFYATSLRRLNFVNESKKIFLKSVKKFPTHLPLRNSFGNLLMESKDFNEAEKQFLQILKLDQNYFDAIINLGRLHATKEQHSKSASFFRKALKLQPTSINAVIGLAEAECKLGNFAVAENFYEDLLKNDILEPRIFNNLANLKRQKGELVEATQLLETSCKVFEPSAIILKNLAACHVLAKNVDAAKALYISIIEENQLDIEAHDALCGLLWTVGEENPFQYIIRLLDDPTTNTALWIKYIQILINIEDYPQAYSWAERLYAANQNDPEAILVIASLKRHFGELDEAISLNRKVLEKVNRSGSSVYLNELGYSLLAKGKGKEAYNIYKKLSKIEFDNQGWWTLFSTAMKQTNDTAQYSWLCDYQNLVYTEMVSSELKGSANFNTELLNTLSEMHTTGRHPVEQSLRNGTQTYEDLFDNPNPLISALKSDILKHAQIFIEQHTKIDRKHPFLSRLSKSLKFNGSWSVCLRNKGYHKSHFHSAGWLSGVYYVDVPDEVNVGGQGWLVFGKPEIPHVDYSGDYAVKPSNGMLVLFPSYMWHGTNAFSSTNNRMTVAFDLVPD
jgi:uncharacterized protein (TIGR02466 family)